MGAAGPMRLDIMRFAGWMRPEEALWPSGFCRGGDSAAWPNHRRHQRFQKAQ